MFFLEDKEQVLFVTFRAEIIGGKISIENPDENIILKIEEINRDYNNEFQTLKDKIKNAPIIDLSKFKRK